MKSSITKLKMLINLEALQYIFYLSQAKTKRCNLKNQAQ